MRQLGLGRGVKSAAIARASGAPRRLGECLEHVFGQQSQGGQFPPFLARYSLPRRCTLDELLRIDTHGFDGTDCVQGAQL